MTESTLKVAYVNIVLLFLQDRSQIFVNLL